MKFIRGVCLFFIFLSVLFLLNIPSGVALAGNQNIFNVLDFGAVPDGRTLNTQAIQKTIDAAHKSNGGKVFFPQGVFLSGSVVLRSNVELHLQDGAVLLGTTDPSAYKGISRWKALILADNQKNIAITGKGMVDGQGRALALNIDSLYYAGQIDPKDYNKTPQKTK